MCHATLFVFSLQQQTGIAFSRNPRFIFSIRFQADRNYLPPKESSLISTAASLVAMIASILPMVMGSTA